MLRRLSWIGLALALGTAAEAAPLRVFTYNTAGLPPLPQAGIPDRSAQFAAMAPLLEGLPDSTLVALQEVFYVPYYDTLASGVTYPSVTPKTNDGPNGIGDGLTLMADWALSGVAHVAWANCFGSGGLNGSDCDTNKGFLFARVALAPGLEVDVYNLHADAGQDTDSVAARQANLAQLAAYVSTNSIAAGRAVIVLGDTNSLYSRSTDTIAAFAAGLGLTDAWVAEALGGLVPDFSATPNNAGCPPPRGSAAPGPAASGASCELVDKIFYRSGTSVQLSLVDYEVALNFVSGTTPLSDHLPVASLFDVTLVPEPHVAALLALGALGLRVRRRA
jgi:hypothetical protein